MLQRVRERFSKGKASARDAFFGVPACDQETANLMLVLKVGGANVVLCASNPLSTQDDVAAALVQA